MCLMNSSTRMYTITQAMETMGMYKNSQRPNVAFEDRFLIGTGPRPTVRRTFDPGRKRIIGSPSDTASTSVGMHVRYNGKSLGNRTRRGGCSYPVLFWTHLQHSTPLPRRWCMVQFAWAVGDLASYSSMKIDWGEWISSTFFSLHRRHQDVHPAHAQSRGFRRDCVCFPGSVCNRQRGIGDGNVSNGMGTGAFL